METQEAQNQSKSRPKHKEGAAVTAAAYATTFYVIGLLTVNSYLFRLGISDFSLLKPQFVYTGVLVALSAVIGPAGMLLQWRIWRGPAELPSKAPRLLLQLLARLSQLDDKIWFRMIDRSYSAYSAAMIPLVPLVIFVFLLCVLQSTPLGLGRESAQHILRGAAALYITNMAWAAAGFSLLVFTAGAAAAQDNSTATQKRSALDNLFYIPVAALLFIAASMWYIELFASNVYPLIPEQFGGGKSGGIKLLFTHDGLTDAAQLGIPIPQGAQISEKVAVLFESSEMYVLRLPDGRVVTVTKKLIAGTVPLP